MNITLEGKDIRWANRFEYLGGTLTVDGRKMYEYHVVFKSIQESKAEVRRRIQVGVNAWRRVEGVMADRKMSRKLKDVKKILM